MFLNNRKNILVAYAVIAVISGLLLFNLKFSFSFEQFFPQGDDELEFFNEFIKEFETDDNFLLLAVENHPSVFDSSFLTGLEELALELEALEHVTQVQSLLNFKYPVKTPFGISSVKALHPADTQQLQKDSIRILNDPRFVSNLISKDATSICFAIKTIDFLSLEDSKLMMAELDLLLSKHQIKDHHLLGRAYFMSELANMQFREVIVSTVVSIFLVSLILIFLFRKAIGILIALSSIGLGLLVFMGLLSLWGRELNAMAAFYPVLMLIVGTSDIIHIMSKYVDELGNGKNNNDAILITIKEIGWATLLTSLTTAAGFLSLVTSKIEPIRDFGINSAIGVLVAYFVVITFSTALLSLFPKDKIIKDGSQQMFWNRLMTNSYFWNKKHPIKILIGSVLFLIFCAVGMSKITTNYKIISNLPIGEKITADFHYFEKEFGGFRPMEFAIEIKEPYQIFDKEVVFAINEIEDKINATGAISNTLSITTLYKSINQMLHSNNQDFYRMPDKKDFDSYRKYLDKLPKSGTAILISEDQRKTRITSKVNDLGADSVKMICNNLNVWIDSNIDSDILSIRQTGTGVIIDKNAEYMRDNLIYGLGLALLIVSILMMFLFRDWRYLIISFIPNVIPLLFASAILGYFSIALEASISIIFALVFGIAVDDTIHFLSKYKLAFEKTGDKELALQQTYEETGKALLFTSIILFFGFLVLLFSIHPPSVTIGTLISITLVSAFVADLMLIPWLIRKMT